MRPPIRFRLAVVTAVLIVPALATASGPAGFLENIGQFDEQVLYRAPSSRMAVYLTPEGLVLDVPESLGSPRSRSAPDDDTLMLRDFPRASTRRGCVVRVLFHGADPAPAVEAHGPLPGRVNFIRGADPAAWRTGARLFSEVVYRDVWPGIDLVWRVGPGRIDCEAVARPGADVTSVRFDYEGADRILRDGSEVRIETPVGVLTHRLPRPGETDGFLAAGNGAGEVPSLRSSWEPGWCTLLGGAGEDNALAVVPDAAGCPIVAGYTTSDDFPTTDGVYSDSLTGAWDVFLTKLDADGETLLWSTYLGGTMDDWAVAVRLDPMADVVVLGGTISADFPTTPGAFDETASNPIDDEDTFVTKLSGDVGTLRWSTYIAGGQNDRPHDMVLDDEGNVVLTGFTYSGVYPTTPGAYRETLCCWGNGDAFVTKLADTGDALVWSTLLGGDMNTERAMAITLDLQGHPIVTGAAGSDFPTTAGAFDTSFNGANDAFVTKLSTAGDSLVWSTFLGGLRSDPAFGVAVDPSGEVIFAGRTYSENLPTTPGAFQETHSAPGSVDSYVGRFSSDGSSLLWLTYVGGTGLGGDFPGDWMGYLALGPAGSPVIAGSTNSEDYPITEGALQSSFQGGGYDGFITFLSPDGSDLLWSTYCGGSDDTDEGFGWDWASNIAVHDSATVFVTGATSATDHPTFPAGVWDTTFDGPWDAVVLAIPLPPVDVPMLPAATAAGLNLACRPNPFRGETTIRYELPAVTPVRVTVLDPAGRLVRILCDEDEAAAGAHALSWDGLNESGLRVGAGVYFLRLEASGRTAAERAVLLR